MNSTKEYIKNYKISDLDYNIKKKFNILIVDDDIEIAQLMKYVLEDRGHNITILEEGTQGLHRIIKNQYDIIFLDYHLYNNDLINGSDICKLSKEYNNNSLIFGYTGDNSKKIINNFKSSGTNGILFKPIDINSFNILMSNLESKLEKNIINKSFKNNNSIIFFS